jgi:predicted dehydrogenase
MTIGVGLIGCGLVGRKRAAALPDGATLVAAFDRDISRAQAIAETQAPSAEVAASVDALVDRDDIGLVIVATQHRDLPELADAALGAGRHVLVEKPGAADVAGARMIANQAQTAHRIARVGFNHRFHPSMLAARAIVDRSSYGPILHIRARYGHGGRVGYEGEWRADPLISGGGELIDQGTHLIDLTRFLVGDVSLAFSELRTSFWPMQVEDNAFLAVRSDTGVFAWLHASWTEWKNLFSFEITFQTAKIEIAGLGGSYGTETLTLYEMSPEMGPPACRQEQWSAADDSWRRELDDVIATIEGNTTALGADIDDAVAALSIVDAAYRADS